MAMRAGVAEPANLAGVDRRDGARRERRVRLGRQVGSGNARRPTGKPDGDGEAKGPNGLFTSATLTHLVGNVIQANACRRSVNPKFGRMRGLAVLGSATAP
jgi:hypothetical protein